MKILTVTLLGAVLSAAALLADPFSFDELLEKPLPPLPARSELKTNDGLRLAYYKYAAPAERASLVFIHGGGAHSGAGYQLLAQELSKQKGVTVYLMDLRGHGQSTGDRGDAGKSEFVLSDLVNMIHTIQGESTKPLFLGGHSSGAGLILNFLTAQKELTVKGVLFVSPEFGFRSKTARDNIKEPFASPHMGIFVLSAFSGRNLFNSSRAVDFNYPPRILKADPLLLSGITTSMAYALTPEAPLEQAQGLRTPVTLVIGEQDELINPDKLKPYVEMTDPAIRAKSSIKVIPTRKHLSILLKCSDSLADAIDHWLAN